MHRDVGPLLKVLKHAARKSQYTSQGYGQQNYTAPYNILDEREQPTS